MSLLSKYMSFELAISDFNLLTRPTEATNSKDGFNVKKYDKTLLLINDSSTSTKHFHGQTPLYRLSTADGARELRLAFIVSPAKEKILSDGALVAGIASTTPASFDSVGYVCC